MRHSTITATCPIDNRTVLDKDIYLLNMANPISMKISVKASTTMPLGKPLPGDKIFRLDPAIHFYEIEDRDESEKCEESEILVVYDSSLAASKQILFKRQFPCINMFNHEGPVVINAMHDLTVRLFEHLKIISPTDMEKRLAYTRILRGSALLKYREILVTCKQLANELTGDEFTLGNLSGVSTEDF